MKEYAYRKLLEAIENNELDLYLRTDPKYLIVDKGDRGVNFNIDYYSMADSLNTYLQINPNQKDLIKNEILKTLKNSTFGGVRSMIEMAAYQLRYGENDIGFLDDDILRELKTQILIHKKDFLNNPDYNYEELDELVFENSGKHIL